MPKLAEFRELERTLSALSVKLSPAQIAQVARKSAQTLRKANTDRLAKNVDPEGEAMAPRKKDADGKIRTRAKMFKKLRAARHLRAKGNAKGLEAGWNSSDSRIARVHHEGLKDRIERRGAKTYQYPERPLLGFSMADDEALIAAVVDHLDL